MVRRVLCAAVLLVAGACGGGDSGTDRVALAVFLEADITPEQRAAVRSALLAHRDTASVDFEDQEEAYENLQDQFADKPETIESVTAADLPESFRVAVEDGADLTALTEAVEGLPGVQEVIRTNQAAGGR